MGLYRHEIVSTERQQFKDITDIIRDDIRKSGVNEGIVIVYCPHTTAAITVNENCDPDVQSDLLDGYEKVFPTASPTYRHYEGNTHAHLKSSAMGVSKTFIIAKGAVVLGKGSF